MAEENKGNNSNKKTKEKKYFGFMDFTENTEKWGKVFIVALLVLMLSLTLSRVYDNTYNSGDCPEEGCATNEEEQLEIAETKLEKQLEDENQQVKIDEATYKLYQVVNQNEYVLVGWEEIPEKGTGIAGSVSGIEEKELISTGKNNKYVMVWGAPEERMEILIENNEAIEYNKEPMDIKLIELEAKDAKSVTFK